MYHQAVSVAKRQEQKQNSNTACKVSSSVYLWRLLFLSLFTVDHATCFPS